jgi:CheY-like chemotaxis protein
VDSRTTAGEAADCLILVVEDDAPIRRIVVALLRDEPGLRVLEARDGTEALETVARVRPDAVLLDMHLPGIGGAEVCRRLKADPATAGVPVVAVSAAYNEAAARAAGCDDFVAKPFDLQDLVDRVRRWLGAGSPRREAAERGQEVADVERFGQPDGGAEVAG